MLRVLNSEHRLPGGLPSGQQLPWREAETVLTLSLDQRQCLDLYLDLSWLPKNIDLARDPMKDDPLADVESEALEDLPVRQQGRLRHKKALLAKLQKGEPGPVSSATLARPLEEPEQKRIKQDHPADGDRMNCGE